MTIDVTVYFGMKEAGRKLSLITEPTFPSVDDALESLKSLPEDQVFAVDLRQEKAPSAIWGEVILFAPGITLAEAIERLALQQRVKELT